MSVSEEPKPDELPTSKVHFRLADGSGVARTFLASDKLQTVFNFALSLRAGARMSPDSFALCSMKPRRRFLRSDMDYTLEQLGLVPCALLLLIPAAPEHSIKPSE